MNVGGSAIRVLLVDDSALVREGLRSVISTHGKSRKIVSAGEAATASEALGSIRKIQPDVVLLDIRLPDGSGLDVCREIRRIRPESRVLILTSVATDELIHQAVLAGAQGYLMKEIDPDRLMSSIADAALGKSVFTGEISDRLIRLLHEGVQNATSPLASLSPQERRVLSLVAEGMTNKEIADKIGLSDNTVKNYLGSVFEKLQVKRRSQAVALFAQDRTLDKD